MKQSLREGMTTKELDAIGAAALKRHGAHSAPTKLYRFPGTTCISINQEAAHGIPSERVIRKGDLINIDVSAELGGYYADTGFSIPFGMESGTLVDLCACPQRALRKGLGVARAGAKINRIGEVVEQTALAVETFVSTGGEFAVENGDGWTLVADDGGFVAQYEHTIVVTDGEPMVMTRL